MKFTSQGPVATKLFARELAKEVLDAKPLHAFVIALQGDLGAGKTTFTQGFMKGLGVLQKIQSPTFVLHKKFSLKHKKSQFQFVIHADAYRLKNHKDLETFGFHRELKNNKNIILIEWPEKVQKIIPKHALVISFQHKKKNERIIALREKR